MIYLLKIESYRDLWSWAFQAELHEVLSKWLINHIQHDDVDYLGAVKKYDGIIKEKERKRETGLLVSFHKWANGDPD